MEGLVERGPEQALDMPMSGRMETIQQSLQRKRARIVQQLADVDAALAAVEAQPGIIDAINALRKVGF